MFYCKLWLIRNSQERYRQKINLLNDFSYSSTNYQIESTSKKYFRRLKSGRMKRTVYPFNIHHWHFVERTHKDDKMCGSIFELYAFLFITTKLTPWSGSRLQKIIGAQIVKKFLTFYGTQRFITVFTRVRTYKSET